MKKTILMCVLMLILTGCGTLNLNTNVSTNEKSCQQDSDCACGKHIDTGQCFFGNKKFVNTAQQCQDYCSGFSGQLTISCIDGTCQQIDKTK